MPVAPVLGLFPVSTRPADAQSRLVRWAVRLAAAPAVAVATWVPIFVVAYVISGTIDVNWVGSLVEVSVLGGLLGALAGFALAVVARAKHVPWALLWLPLTVFPALLAFLMLGEAFWWE